ncbi:MAG: sodium:calcium antiporter [Acidimicrobiales bacterium]
MVDAVVLVLGVLAAALGGELFVRGAVGLASWARVPAGIIGVTVAAFATSSPEMSVAIQSAVAREPEIALGDALGSNVVNLGIVLGVTLLLGPLAVVRAEVRRDLATAALAPVLTVAVLVDGRMVRVEATVLLVVFVAWLVLVGRDALRRRSAVTEAVDPPRRLAAVASALGGLAFLVVAGRLIVEAAKGIGDTFGLDPYVVGATLVALGTSAPELATAIVSRARGHVEVGVGTVLGSNVFNNLWIVGLAGVIEPIRADAADVLVAVGGSLVALALVVPPRVGLLPLWRGVALVAVAVAYAAGTLALGSSS